jgi:AraC family transcriptional regulator
MHIETGARCVLTPFPAIGETPWGGLGIQSFFVGSGFHPKPDCPSMHLFLYLRGSPKIAWRDGRKNFQRNWKHGDYTFVGKDLEVFDLSIEGDHEGLAIDIPSDAAGILLDDDFSMKCPSLTSLPPHLYGTDPHIFNMALSMKDEIAGGCPSGKIFAESMSLALLTYFYGRHRNRHSPVQQRNNALNPTKLKFLEEYILENIGNNLSLTELAALVKVSPSQFSRNFSMATGMPPHRYVMHLRIEKAKTLLQSSFKSVTDVALELGFASPSHFSFAFRKFTGASPKEFLQL